MGAVTALERRRALHSLGGVIQSASLVSGPRARLNSEDMPKKKPDSIAQEDWDAVDFPEIPEDKLRVMKP